MSDYAKESAAFNNLYNRAGKQNKSVFTYNMTVCIYYVYVNTHTYTCVCIYNKEKYVRYIYI